MHFGLLHYNKKFQYISIYWLSSELFSRSNSPSDKPSSASSSPGTATLYCMYPCTTCSVRTIFCCVLKFYLVPGIVKIFMTVWLFIAGGGGDTQEAFAGLSELST